ncbi:hypothetical protein BU15DRAFT_65720 [Melanogaster broomeanus]|nr:hypothetical protein BU15DRAFT_65720 [Melanogaster broomeanus]
MGLNSIPLRFSFRELDIEKAISTSTVDNDSTKSVHRTLPTPPRSQVILAIIHLLEWRGPLAVQNYVQTADEPDACIDQRLAKAIAEAFLATDVVLYLLAACRMGSGRSLFIRAAPAESEEQSDAFKEYNAFPQHRHEQFLVSRRLQDCAIYKHADESEAWLRASKCARVEERDHCLAPGKFRGLTGHLALQKYVRVRPQLEQTVNDCRTRANTEIFKTAFDQISALVQEWRAGLDVRLAAIVVIPCDRPTSGVTTEDVGDQKLKPAERLRLANALFRVDKRSKLLCSFTMIWRVQSHRNEWKWKDEPNRKELLWDFVDECMAKIQAVEPPFGYIMISDQQPEGDASKKTWSRYGHDTESHLDQEDGKRDRSLHLTEFL